MRGVVWVVGCLFFFVFFFNDTATTEIYTLSLHDALPISRQRLHERSLAVVDVPGGSHDHVLRHGQSRARAEARTTRSDGRMVRKSSRRRSSNRRPSTEGWPVRSRSSRLWAGSLAVPSERPALGRATVGRAPPPTSEVVSTSSAPNRAARSAERRRRKLRARRRIDTWSSVSIRSVGIVSRASPAS